MPKYLKNKRRRRHYTKIKSNDNIIMSENQEEDKETEKKVKKRTSLKILNGKKKAKKIRRIIALGLVMVIVLTINLISYFSATGIVELWTNFSATFSLKSHLPVELKGTETYSIGTNDNYFHLLSDTDITVISHNGKVPFRDNHGFSSPVLCESDARCLIYDQNGKGVRIYNAAGLVLTKESSSPIYCADIGRNGSFVVASKAENYTSMLSVYNIDGDLIYEWFCPEEIINAVAIAPNGKSVAVGTVSVSEGDFDSAVYVLEYDSANPVFEQRYKDDYIYSINSVSRSTFTVVCKNRSDIITWNNRTVNSYKSEYNINFVRANNKRTVIASSRENNDTSYMFAVYDSDGKHSLSFDFDGQVDDFRILGSNIFILSGNTIYLINSNGTIVRKGTAGYGTGKIAPVSSSACLVVGHNSVTKISLQ